MVELIWCFDTGLDLVPAVESAYRQTSALPGTPGLC